MLSIWSDGRQPKARIFIDPAGYGDQDWVAAMKHLLEVSRVGAGSATRGRRSWLAFTLIVDGHAQFAQYSKLNPGTLGGYNLDWTEDGLRGADLR